MNCKSCGAPIPDSYLRLSSFKCPECGTAYRRSSRPQAKKTPPKAPARSGRGGFSLSGVPKWAWAALSALVVVIALALLLAGRGGSPRLVASGQVVTQLINPGEFEAINIEIPRQKDANYMVVTEMRTGGLGCSVNQKTENAFTLFVRNLSSDARNTEVKWALVTMGSKMIDGFPADYQP